MTRRVIFVADDYWTTPPEETTVTDQPDDHPTDTAEDLRAYRGQLAAVDLCRAISTGDFSAAEQVYTNEDTHGLMRELVAGVAHLAVSLAKTIEQKMPGVSEENIWATLAERSATGLIGSAEIDKMTSTGDEPA